MDLKAREAEGLPLSAKAKEAAYRPVRPNQHWEAGAIARMAQVSRTGCPLTYPGSRWEWEAGWDYEDQEIRAGR